MAAGEKFIDAAKDFIAYVRAQNYEDELWLTFYPDIAKQLGLWYGLYAAIRHTFDHMELVLTACEHHFLQSLGHLVKELINIKTCLLKCNLQT